MRAPSALHLDSGLLRSSPGRKPSHRWALASSGDTKAPPIGSVEPSRRSAAAAHPRAPARWRLPYFRRGATLGAHGPKWRAGSLVGPATPTGEAGPDRCISGTEVLLEPSCASSGRYAGFISWEPHEPRGERSALALRLVRSCRSPARPPPRRSCGEPPALARVGPALTGGAHVGRRPGAAPRDASKHRPVALVAHLRRTALDGLSVQHA